MKRITIVTSEKGGVGKSFHSKIKTEFKHKNSKVLLIDSDIANPDVCRYFKNSDINSKQINLTNHNGWMDFIDLLDEEKDIDEVVVNMPARTNKILIAEAEVFFEVCKQLNFKVVIDFVISRDTYCLVLLKQLYEGLSGFSFKLNIVLNGYFGEQEKFTRWHESKIRKQLLDDNRSELYLPDLDDRIVDKLKAPTLELLKTKELSLSERMNLERWITKVFNKLEEMDNE
ncbi:P-loop NTPase [Endozoicomonas euniceicola]|uniref:P-loop NTPase n=1 Tax=Endozoicomonas euniceicola TaxID=1234143 RepID=A0ABY6H0K4_9GAMM|nr:P-loop NTPase [Endozoicomonas euniceicola]UYM18590.1 P-loop NTPase [Endozoicomonas euniceicola]